jgi:hypothetical protein
LTLYRASCPGRSIVSSQTSNIGGGYVFTNLAPDNYCLVVDALSPANISLLSPGSWTHPEGSTGQITITLASGQNLTDNNFGWQFAQE